MTLSGNPAVVATTSAQLIEQSRLIQEAAEELLAITFDGTALALDAVRERSAETADLLSTAHSRYRGTGNALSIYGVELNAAHAKANRADDEEAFAARRMSEYEHEAHILDTQIRALSGDPEFLGRVRQLEAQLGEVNHHHRAQTATYTDARARHAQAQREMNDAAERARALVKSVLETSNQGFWNHVTNFFSDVGGVLSNLRDWAEQFLSQVWAAMKRVMSTIAAVLAVAVVILVLFKLALAAPFIIGVVVAAAAAFLAVFLMTSILSDVLTPTPQVSRKQVDALIRDEYTNPAGLSEVLMEAVEVDQNAARDITDTSVMDKAGSPVETIVKLTRVVDTDGIVRWRVALPSTQEWLTWLHGNDGGAVNDLDSNLALMLTPALKTQYERAVIEAMKQAGVGREDPVMLVGFSQGGIMAGHLAAYNTEYHWDTVVAAGAPIDNMPIPKSTNVISIQHAGDPVHHLDTGIGGTGRPPNSSNWVTIHAEVPGAGGVKSTHSADAYQQTMARPENISLINSSLENISQGYFHREEGTYGANTEYYRWNE